MRNTLPRIRTRNSGGIKGGGGHGGKFPPVGGSVPPPPPTCPQSEEKNGQNQPFSANFWIFTPSGSHFAPSMPPPKKNSGAATTRNCFMLQCTGQCTMSLCTYKTANVISFICRCMCRDNIAVLQGFCFLTWVLLKHRSGSALWFFTSYVMFLHWLDQSYHEYQNVYKQVSFWWNKVCYFLQFTQLS